MLGVDLDRLALDSHLPLERCADMIAAVLEREAEHIAHRATDRLLGLEASQLEGPPSAIDDPPLTVTREKRGIWGRVVVVQELEQIGESALLAAASLAAKALVAAD